MQIHFLFYKFALLLIIFTSTVVFSADRRPWYRSKKWAQKKAEKAEKESERQHRIQWHKEIISAKNKEVKHIDWLQDGVREEIRQIPFGSSKQVEIAQKIDERRRSEMSIKKQKFVSDLLQKHENEKSQAIRQNIANASSKHQRIQEHIEKLKSESTHDPALEQFHKDHYFSKLDRLGEEKCSTCRELYQHKYLLKEIEDTPKKKKGGLWRWKPFRGKNRNH